VVCLLPALIYYLFITTRKVGIFNDSIDINEKAILAQQLSTQSSLALAGLKRAGCDPDSVSQANGHRELESAPAQ
jgi:hypothetical protein